MAIDTYEAIFYDGITGNHPAAEMPPQALPESQKNERWREANANALENIGVIQFRENMKFNDFYRMVDGKMSYSELSEVIPQLRELEKTLDDCDIPSYLKHYDIIGVIVNALAGELVQSGDKYNVTNIDEIATNEYLRTRDKLLQDYIKEEFNKELTLRMVQEGIDPYKNQFESEQEKQAYMQEVQRARQAMTPPQIQQHMNSEWKTNAIKWGEHTLEADNERFRMSGMDRQEFIDYLLTGRCFRHFKVGYDYYKPERWSPINTFFSQDLESNRAEDCEYIGRVHFYTPNQIINRYPEILNEKQKRSLLSKNRNVTYPSKVSSVGGSAVSSIVQDQFHEKKIVPFANYYDHKFLEGLEDTFGIPATSKTVFNKDGSSTTVPSWIPRSMDNSSSSVHRYASVLREDLNLRKDIIQVTEGYFMSQQRVGYLTYETPSGRLETVTVTDELLPEFLKENDITIKRTMTLEEVEANPEAGTIVYDYTPQWWSVLKISDENLYLDKPIYDVRPMEYQIKGDSNIYDLKPPVAGIIDKTSLANKLQPYQVILNIVNNQIYNLLEKEIGLFFMFDINFLPSEYKGWGNTEDALLQMRSIAKNLGLFPIDGSKQNTHNSAFNQFAPQNITFTGQINDRITLSEVYTQKALEQVGITRQRLGTPTKYETATGVQQGLESSYAQTEIYFDPFLEYKGRALEIHLTVAQYAQGDGKDISVFYTKSDSTKAFLQFTDENFSLRKFGILPVSNSKKRKELEMFKQYLLNTNTLANDELDLAKLIASDTMSEAIEIARNARLEREKTAQVQQERLLEQIEVQAQADDEKETKTWQREEVSNERDRKNRIQTERIEALGRAADNDATTGVDQINREADKALEREHFNKEQTQKTKDRETDKDKFDEEMKFKWAQLKQKADELQQRNQDNASNEFIAVTNKN